MKICRPIILLPVVLRKICLIELFSEAFGAEKAGYLYSQYHFYDIYQNSRYADFGCRQELCAN